MMQFTSRAATVVFLSFLSFSAHTIAGDAKLNPDGSLSWEAGVDGVEIEWHPNGKVKRIFSRYGTPVEFSDRRGISKAQVIAEEKAKANIIRFMDQSVSSTRVVTEVQADINKATQTRETGKADSLRKVDERVVMESLTEITGSFASGELKGVIVLERGYNKELQEAWVVVGISDKTIAAAESVKAMNRGDAGPSTSGASTSSTQQGSEIRRTKQKEW